MHITELPRDGWARRMRWRRRPSDERVSEYVLFTDADVLFSPSMLRRALAYAEVSRRTTWWCCRRCR